MVKEKISILLIDDDGDFRGIITDKLAQEGFDVSQAASGPEGIDQLRKHKPDLVLLDVQMPGMSGIATLSAIKSDPQLADMKVVFLTNFGELAADETWLDEKFAKETGALGYIRKSEDLAIIVQKVTAFVSSK
jgi:CheY-like chemotaxis protein